MNLDAFVDRSNDRRLPPGYDGDLFVWDIDKTYLDTHFSTWRGLLRVPIELAVDKVSIAGAVPLLRGLRRGATSTDAPTRGEPVPLYFVSGSPKQLREAVERKMTLDGVGFDGITFKDQWGLFRAGRIADLRTQVGYKLKALLGYARAFQDDARWWLFGDDVEQDAETFLLFGRILAGLRDRELRAELEARRVPAPDREVVLALASQTPVRDRDPVHRVYVMAHKRPDATHPDPRIVVMPTFLTGALDLARVGRIDPTVVTAVAKDLRSRGVPEARIAASLQAAARHAPLPQDLVARASL